jgi:YidC/Oxa1 family membrane protein insertase
MPNILGVPLDAAYYVVTSLAGALTPLTGALSVALAIVLFTIAVRLVLLPFSYYGLRGQLAQARLAPRIQALSRQHRRNPERLSQEIRALHRANGTSMFTGYLPLLLQWPFLTVMYLLFRSATINGAPNSLLHHHLFGALLSTHWLSGPGPFSLQGAVFAMVFVLLGSVAYLSARLNRRLFPRPTSTTDPLRPASTNRPTATMPSWLANVLPLVTVVFAAFVPLAGGVYLLTTTTWTLLERRLLARHLQQAPPPPAPAVKTPARAA